MSLCDICHKKVSLSRVGKVSLLLEASFVVHFLNNKREL